MASMASWGRLNPLNLLTRSTQRHDSETEGPSTNFMPSIVEGNSDISDIPPQTLSTNTPFIQPPPDAYSPFPPSSSTSVVRSLWKKTKVVKEEPSTPTALNRSSSFRKSKSFLPPIDTDSSRHTPSSDPVNRTSTTPASATSTTFTKQAPITPLHAKNSSGSFRSILRDRHTPGTGQSVRFFSRDAYRVITPNASAAEESSTEVNSARLSAVSLEFEKHRPNGVQPHPDVDDDQRSSMDQSSIERQLQTTNQRSLSTRTSSSPNLSSQLHPYPSLQRSHSSPTPTVTGELVGSDPFARASPSSSQRSVWQRGVISPDFFTPPRATSSPPPSDPNASTDSQSLSFAQNTKPFNMSQEVETIGAVEDITGANGDSIEIPRYSGEIDPGHFFEQTEYMSMATSTPRSSSTPNTPTDSSLNRTPERNLLSTTADSLRHDDRTAFHSIVVSTPGSNMSEFPPAESSSALLGEYTPEQSSQPPNGTTYFTPGADHELDSFSEEDIAALGPLPALLSAQDELISNLRNELSFQHDITNQFEADLSARDELVEVLSFRVQSAEQEAASWRVDGERKEERVRRMKQKVYEMQKECQRYYDQLEKSREENLGRSLLDQASGQALRALHSQIEQLSTAKNDLETQVKDLEIKFEAERESKSQLEGELQAIKNDLQHFTAQTGGSRDREVQLDSRLSALEEELGMWKREYNKLAEMNDELNVEIETTRQTFIEERTTTLEQWNHDREEISHMTESALAKASNDLQILVKNKDQQLKKLEDELHAQWAYTERHTEEMRIAELERKEMEQEMVKMNREIKGLERKVEEAETRVGGSVDERDRMGEAIVQLENNIVALKEERNELAGRLEEVEAALMEIENERDQLADDCENARTAREELSERYDGLSDAHRVLGEDYDKLHDEHQHLSGEFALVQERNQDLQDRVHKLESENSHLSSAVRDREREAKAIREDQDRLRRDAEREFNHHDRTVQDLEHLHQQSQSALDAALRERAAAVAEKDNMEELFRLLREESELLRRRVQDLQKESSARNVKIISLEKHRDQDEEDKEALGLALEAKQQELDIMKRKFGVRGTAGTTPAPSRITNGAFETVKRAPRESYAGMNTPSVVPRPALAVKDNRLAARPSVASIEDSDASEKPSETEDEAKQLKASTATVRGPRMSVALPPSTTAKYARRALNLDENGQPQSVMSSAIRIRPRSSLASTTGTATPIPGIRRPPSVQSHARRPSISSAAPPLRRSASAMEKNTPGRLMRSPSPSVNESDTGLSEEKENYRPRGNSIGGMTPVGRSASSTPRPFPSTRTMNAPLSATKTPILAE